MSTYSKGKDGRFTGSIVDGKTHIPSPSDIPTVPATAGSRDAGVATPDPAAEITSLHAAFRNRSDYYGPRFRTGTPTERIDISRTGNVGEVSTDYETLTRVFGEPLPGDGYKTTTEWHVEFTDDDGSTVTATVYDWKNYDGFADEDDEQVIRPVGQYEWMVGGHDARAADLVNQAIHSLY